MPGTIGSSLAVALGLAGTAQAFYTPTLIFSGACDDKNELNGLVFEPQGLTASGAPYYKATTRSEYMYFDPDCSGGGDGSPRWIVDSSAPSTSRERDLDGDGSCNYHARFDTSFKLPPMAGYWRMRCGGFAEDRYIILLAITTTRTTTTKTTSTSTVTTRTTTTSTSSTITTTLTSTSTSTSTTTPRTTTTTTASTTSQTAFRAPPSTSTSTTPAAPSVTTSSTATATTTTTSTSSSAAAPPAGVSSTTPLPISTSTTTLSSSTATEADSGNATEDGPANATEVDPTNETTTLHLHGACAAKEFLNGLAFEQIGVAGNGAAVYKAAEAEQYLYYDLACDGGEEGQARWILDADMPNMTLSEDLDEDGACNYHARHDSENAEQPPLQGSWHMFCGRSWVDVPVSLRPEPLAQDAPEDETADQDPPRTLRLKANFCAENQQLSGLSFDLAGAVADGSPYYRAEGKEAYIYLDRDCDGAAGGNAAARWILDVDAPSERAGADLDGDGACNYVARAPAARRASEDLAGPPAEAAWRVFCNGTWQDLWLSLETVERVEENEESGAAGLHGPAIALALTVVVAVQGWLGA